MFDFVLEGTRGTPVYVQLVQQVKNGIRLGYLHPGDRLPTAKDVVANLAVNPNTVLKAYRELEREGLVTPRAGAGTFIRSTLGTSTAKDRDRLLDELREWMNRAAAANLDEDDVLALFTVARQPRPVRRRG